VKCRKPPGVEFGAPILTERGLVPCSSADDAALLKKAVGVAERTDAVGVDVRALGTTEVRLATWPRLAGLASALDAGTAACDTLSARSSRAFIYA